MMTYGLNRRVLFAMALLLGAAVAGCGGGGGSSPATVPALPNSHGTAQGQVSIKIPPKTTGTSSSRKPAYVSPDTESIGIVVTPNGQPAFPVVMIDVPGSDCTGDAETGYSCTVTVLAQPGDNSLVITTYSLPNGGGSVLSSGTFDQNFTAGQTPAPINVTLAGVVNSVVLSIQHDDINGTSETDQNVPVGQSATLDVTAEDAAGNAIIGSYATPITISSSSSGLTLSQTTFKDSTTTSAQITWQGAPYYYGAPIDPVKFQALEGTTQVGSIQLNPESTVLSFPAGDGTANDDAVGLGLVAVANKLYYTTFGYYQGPTSGGRRSEGEGFAEQGGNLGMVDIAAGTQTISSPLNYLPAGVYVDPAYQGIWVANVYDQTYNTGTLECYTAVTNEAAADVPVPAPEASDSPQSDPLSMTSDSKNNLWFADGAHSDIGYAPMTGQCAIDPTTFRLFTSPTTSDFTTLATDGSNVFVNDLQNPDVWWANAGSDGVTSILLPDSSNTAAAVANDQAGNIDVADIGETASSIDTIPSGTTAFGTSSVQAPELGAYDLTSVGTGDSKIFAAANLGLGGISYLPVGNPTLATNLGAPNTAENYGCTVVAFDASQMPWAICSDGTYAHLDRFILTDAAWNLFLDTSATGLDAYYETVAGIGGGSPSTTFTVVCSGVIQCTMVSGRSFTVGSEGSGSATVQVTGSDGRVVTQNFTVTLDQSEGSVGRRLAESAFGRRLLGKRVVDGILRH